MRRYDGFHPLVFILFLVFPVICFTATIQVDMTDFSFDPDSVTVDQGDTVVWINQVTTNHTTTSGVPCTPDGIWDSGLMAQNDSFSYVFEFPGDYPYFCTPHCAGGMTGNVEVTMAPPPGCIGGVVRDTGGQVLEGVLVEAFQSWVVMGEDTTDADGRYDIIPLDPGNYDAVASQQGYLPDTATDIPVSSGCRVQNFWLEPVPIECGDVNADGRVTFADALYIKNYYFQTPPGSPAPVGEGDVNEDGRVTFADALYIKNYYFQTPPGSSAPCEP
jgi:plastocyanin